MKRYVGAIALALSISTISIEATASNGFNGPGWYKIVFSPIGAAVFGGPYPNKSACERTRKDSEESCAYYANQSSWDKDGITLLR